MKHDPNPSTPHGPSLCEVPLSQPFSNGLTSRILADLFALSILSAKTAVTANGYKNNIDTTATDNSSHTIEDNPPADAAAEAR